MFPFTSSNPNSSSSSSDKMQKQRLKREECHSTRHDSVFSNWEILVGSTDWEDYYVGKDGAQRYRIYNLPNGSSCPGLYELGIALIPHDDGRKSRRHDCRNILVVYLGQTNNVRTRLQRYGRIGAHLDSGKLDSSLNENECPGLFKEIFSRGYSIMFRWAPMVDKKKAERTEAELLDVFDYAWNKSGNGACRRDEILSYLDSRTTTRFSNIVKNLQPWNHPAFGRKEGIHIDASVPLDDERGFLLPQVLKFGMSQLQFVQKNSSYEKDIKICGVAIGFGSVCKNRPIFGRKRCEEHKGMKILGTREESSRVVVTNENTTMCGIIQSDGSRCTLLPVHGRKRCELHKGKKISKVEVCDLSHIGLVGLSELLSAKELKTNSSNFESATSRECLKTKEDGNICGVVMGHHVCRRKPVSGRKRCEEHKGQRITMTLPRMSMEGSKEYTKLSECGVRLGDGSACGKLPVPGRKRCEVHKGRRV